MAKLRIKYPIGPAQCPICGNEFNRLRWWTVYCSANCRRLNHAMKAMKHPINASDASCNRCAKIEDRIAQLEKENNLLRLRLQGAGPAFKYDDEDQTLA